jgi:NAD(P)H-nitrite reductase large subunit
MKYVIIGNSAAGIGAVEGIRKVDGHGSISIVSNEGELPYSRPLISYWLSGQAAEDKLNYREKSFYNDHQCQLFAGRTAMQVDAVNKSVTLDDGTSLIYDRLCIATGSSALVPPIAGLDSVDQPHTFMTLKDVQVIKKRLSRQLNVVIIGAGLIGLKCAEGIAGQAAGITVIDQAPRILPSILDEQGALIVQRHLESKGITFKLARRIIRCEKNSLLLDNQDIIKFDMIVLAAGVRPNTGLLEGIAEIDRGIIVDDHGRTTAADIFAAGDCSQTTDVSDGQSKVMALMPNAYLMGECAGINMAGGNHSFSTTIPMNAVGFFGLHIITAGNYIGDIYEEQDSRHYKRLFAQHDRLKGYMLIGDIERAGIYTRLIRQQIPLHTIDYPLICERPGLIAFSSQERQAMLGGPQ